MYYCFDCPFWEELPDTDYHLGFCPYYVCTFDPDEGACDYGLLGIEINNIESEKWLSDKK